MTKTLIAYHFTGDRLRDGTPIPPIGYKLTIEPPLVLCEHGLHWSLHPFDALRYAPGPRLHKVRVSGIINLGLDKGCSTERTILASVDATELFWKAARMFALNVAHLWACPEIMKEFLETGNEGLRDAAWAAAWNAAWNVARAAAWNAAWAAERDAAWDAPRDAARDAAWNAAQNKQRMQFQKLVDEAFGDV